MLSKLLLSLMALPCAHGGAPGLGLPAEVEAADKAVEVNGFVASFRLSFVASFRLRVGPERHDKCSIISIIYDQNFKKAHSMNIYHNQVKMNNI